MSMTKTKRESSSVKLTEHKNDKCGMYIKEKKVVNKINSKSISFFFCCCCYTELQQNLQ